MKTDPVHFSKLVKKTKKKKKVLYEAISSADTLKRDGGSYQCSLVLIPSYNMLERRKNLNPNYPQTQLPVGIEAIANLFSRLHCILFFFMQRRVRKA
jgi:hypothetical protein